MATQRKTRSVNQRIHFMGPGDTIGVVSACPGHGLNRWIKDDYTADPALVTCKSCITRMATEVEQKLRPVAHLREGARGDTVCGLRIPRKGGALELVSDTMVVTTSRLLATCDRCLGLAR